jgi:hypothetical protein
MLDDDNVVEYLTFDGNATLLGVDDITINTTVNPDGERIIIQNCYFKDSVGSNISSANGVDVMIKNNIFDGYKDHAVYFSTTSKKIIIADNIIYGRGIGAEAIKFRNGVEDVIVKNNIADNVSAFTFISAETNSNKNIIISGNKATTKSHSILTSRLSEAINENIIIDSNVFENIGNYTALSLAWNGKAGAKKVQILNNSFKNYKDIGSFSGDDDGLVYLEHILFKNNIVTVDTGITVTSGYMIATKYAKGVDISNNKIKNSVYQTSVIYITGNIDIAIRDNDFDLNNPLYFFDLNNSANVKINLSGNKIKSLGRRLILEENITDDSLIQIINNDINSNEASYPYFYDRNTITAFSKYRHKNNVVNGVDYIDKTITVIPSYIGQQAIVSGVVYIAIGISSTADWKQVSNAGDKIEVEMLAGW